MQDASIVVCSNRPANNNGMSIEEVKFAVEIGKPVIAVSITNSIRRFVGEYDNIFAIVNQQAIINDVIEVKNGVNSYKT